MTEARIKAVETTVDGITFRSRLEATWYLYFKALKMNPIYEPDTFDIYSAVEEDRKLGTYTPDFHLSASTHGMFKNYYVEIKPSLTEYGLRDKKSMSKAIILGYTHPTVIVMGTPLLYHAIVIYQRRKGSPLGRPVEFLTGEFKTSHDIYMNSYPDEHGLTDWEDPRHHFPPTNNHGNITAGKCWSKTRK